MRQIPIDELLTAHFSDEASLAAWGRVEAVLAEAQAELGMIPAEAAGLIATAIAETRINPGDVLRGREQTGHLFIPFLRLIEKECGDAATWLHFGATTENIIYTALCTQLRDALAECHSVQRQVLEQCCALAEEHADTVMAGRTHSQQALPITFGYKVCGWLDEYSRHLERQQAVQDRGLRVMFGGAIGSFAAFGDKGPALQQLIAEKLDMPPMPVPLRSVTDGWVELAQVYALSASTLAKMVIDLKNLSRSEIAEVFQQDGSVGSSTMPQKRNPVLYNAVLHAFERMQSAVQRLLHIRVQADDGDSLCGFMQRDDIADVLRLYYFMLKKSVRILGTLQVNKQRMRDNLDMDGGWIMAEALMLALSDDMGKTEAHDLLHDLAMAARNSGQSLRDAAHAHPDIARLGHEKIDALLDPAGYTGHCGQLTRGCVDRMRAAIS